MKKFIEGNWFKIGLLILAIGVVTMATVIFLKIEKDDNTLAQQKYEHQWTQTPQQVQTTSTTINPINLPSENNTSPQTESSEDSVLKIARCKSDAQIESKLETGRFEAADLMDLTACITNSQCNFSSYSSGLKNFADSIGQSSYDNVYNMCLQTSKSLFDGIERTYEAYWDECISENPYPNDADVSGIEGIKLYGARKDCVSNLEDTDGL
jgi:hypothetical protein